MDAGGAPNTCKSNELKTPSGVDRVANGWVTRDNLPPPPGTTSETEANTGYSGPMEQGKRRGGMGSRPHQVNGGGNGPPCLRRVAGLGRPIGHIGTETRPDSYGRQQWGILRNGGNPDTQRRRVRDEVIRDVNRFQRGRTMTVLAEEAQLTTCQQPR